MNNKQFVVILVILGFVGSSYLGLLLVRDGMIEGLIEQKIAINRIDLRSDFVDNIRKDYENTQANFANSINDKRKALESLDNQIEFWKKIPDVFP